MSEKFLEIAKKELKEDIDVMIKILDSCKTDSDIFKNSNDIEKRLHKIKGLAPMMNQEDIGEISKIGDNLLKHIITNGETKGSYQIITEFTTIMNKIFNGDKINSNDIEEKIKTSFSGIEF